MSTSHIRGRALAASLLGLSIALASPVISAPSAVADPAPQPGPGPAVPPPAPIAQADAPAAQADAPAPGIPGLPPLPNMLPAPGAPDAAPPPDGGVAAKTACSEFSGALDYASVHYEDFADSIAGNGSFVNYADPNVQQSNTTGRTALREAAAVAMDAASTPGLDPSVGNPMRSWSMNAAKLLVIMGVHANGDAVDAAATDVNRDTKSVQMACAMNGTHA